MSMIGLLLTLGGGRVAFWCPGCKTHHQVNIEPHPQGQGPIWGFNGDYDRPTFTPSVLCTSGHYVPGWSKADCWCSVEERTGEKSAFDCFRCHSFVTDGQIQFLGDCTHALAGQTVPLKSVILQTED